MTSTSLYDQAALDTTLAELPPLPMAALMVGVYNLLQDGADLPQPCHVAVSETGQSIDLQFPGSPAQQAGHHPVGAPLRQRRDHAPAPRRARRVHPRHRDSSATTAWPSRPTPTSRPDRPASSRSGEP